ncbi:MAG: serine hydrolase domain-containing protein [Pseudomonadota bacterium]
MPRRALCLFTLVFLPFLSIAARTEVATLAAAPAVEGQIRAFSIWLEHRMAYRGVPGVVVGVVAGDDLVWAQGFGYAELASSKPMRRNTRFRMASHSKLFTATAILQLRDRGQLRLDDPVVQHLPWFAYQAVDPEDPPITIEHLLVHGSGLPREAGTHWEDLDFPSMDELKALIPKRVAAFSPDTRWKYSNLGYALAGMIVEQHSDLSWAQYVAENIFAPLGMEDSSVDEPDSMLATGYGRRMPDGTRAIFPFVDAAGMAPATGLTSTVEDMARFVAAQFRRGARGENRILSTASLREMHRPRMMTTGWERGQGIGFGVALVGDREQVGHPGGYPGYMTFTSIDLDSEIGVIVLTNATDAQPIEIAGELMKTVGVAVATAGAQGTLARPSAAGSASWDPAWSRFTGRYRNHWNDSAVVEIDQQLVVLGLGEPPASAFGGTLEPLGNERFRLSSTDGTGYVGEVVRFIEKDGAVSQVCLGDSCSARIKNF